MVRSTLVVLVVLLLRCYSLGVPLVQEEFTGEDKITGLAVSSMLKVRSKIECLLRWVVCTIEQFFLKKALVLIK